MKNIFTFLILAFATMLAGQAQGNFVIEKTNGFADPATGQRLNFNRAASGVTLGDSLKIDDVAKIQRAANGDFVHKVWDVNAFSAVASIVPKNPAMKYIVAAEPLDSVKGIKNRDGIVEHLRPSWDAWSFAYNITRAQFLDSILHIGTIAHDTILDLKANTDYVLYSFGYTPQEQFLTPVYRTYFRTAPVDSVDIDFTFSAHVNGSVVDLTAVPSRDDVPYYLDCLSDSDIQTYGNGDFDKAVARYLEVFRGFFQYPAHSFYDIIVRQGKETRHMDWLSGGTHYTAFAVALDRGMQIRSKIGRYEFTTTTEMKSDNKIDVKVCNVSSSDAIVVTTPSNTDRYVVGVLPDTLVEGKSDVDILKYMKALSSDDYEFVQYRTIKEPGLIFASQRLETLTPGHKYYAVVYGVDLTEMSHQGKAYITTALQRVPFTLLSEKQTAENLEFYFQALAYDGYGAAFAAYESEKGVPYYADFFEANMTDEQIKAAVADSASAKGLTVTEYVQQRAYKNNAIIYALYGQSKFKWDTPYQAVAIGVNADGTWAQNKFSRSVAIQASATPSESTPKFNQPLMYNKQSVDKDLSTCDAAQLRFVLNDRERRR